MTVSDPRTSAAARDPRAGTLHMIGNAHIDAVWLWPWEEGFAEVKATFASALERMREYPEFVFTCSSAAYYAWVEENAPEMFGEIRQRVADGRWRITGGWWVEPDCNIPSGESFVRQALLGQHYFASRFGRIATVGYNPDAFGHAGSLPQILRGSRLTGYTFLRPEPHEKELPGNLFWWESPDGSRVLAFRINFGYTVWGDLEEHVRRHLDRFVDGTDALLCFYGVGNHGGGPTRANLDTIRALSEADDIPALRHSWPAAFFDEVADAADALPVVRDELQHHAVGCYSVVSGVKCWNRAAEELLGFAERWASVAAREDLQPYPADLAGAWGNVLFNQYHDILAGTSIEPAYDDARSQLGESIAIADRALTNGVQAISWAVDTRGPAGARPIVAFNPHAWPSRVPVEIELGRHAEGGRLLDDAGREVTYQEVRPLATSRGRHRITFLADLPSLGYRRYLLVPTDPGFEWHETAAAVGEVGEATASQAEGPIEEELVEGERPHPGEASADAPPDLRAGETWIESERWRLELDPARGDIGQLVDRRAGRDVFSGPAGRAIVAEDRSDTWSHGVTHYERGEPTFDAERVRLVEDGPLRATLHAASVRPSDGSRLTVEYTIHRDHPRIDLRVTVDWRGRYEILKLRFPVAVTDPVATWETSYGHIQRATDGAERPGQRWLDVSGDGAGVAILNDGKYSSDVLGSEIGITVLRSPIYAWHDPFVPEPDGVYPFVDQGRHTFRLSILPHDGDWRAAAVPRRAAELNAEPMIVLETGHPGPMPAAASFATCSAPSVALTVLKRAEVGEALVLRAHETWGRATGGRIELPRWGIAWDATFGAGELKTWRIERDGAVRETDLLEGLEAEPA